MMTFDFDQLRFFRQEWSVACSIFNIKAQGLAHCIIWMKLSQNRWAEIYFHNVSSRPGGFESWLTLGKSVAVNKRSLLSWQLALCKNIKLGRWAIKNSSQLKLKLRCNNLYHFDILFPALLPCWMIKNNLLIYYSGNSKRARKTKFLASRPDFGKWAQPDLPHL